MCIKYLRYELQLSCFLFFSFFVSSAHAIIITGETDPNVLANAILGTGIAVTSSTLDGNSLGSGEVSSGTYTNASGTYGIGAGVVLSSGDVNDYNDGPNNSANATTDFGTSANAAQEVLLDPISGGGFDHNDVTQFDVVFDVDGSTDTVFFNVAFGSEEFSEFVGSDFIDAFGIYLNGVNIALFDGSAININHPDMMFTSGTELDGLIDPSAGSGAAFMLFSGGVTPGTTGNTLQFILADTSDNILDTTVYISALGSTPPPIDPPIEPTPVPEPTTLALLSLSLAGLGFTRRKMKA